MILFFRVRPFSQRNFNINGEISVPVKFEDYEATIQFIPKRDRVIIRVRDQSRINNMIITTIV